MNAINPQEVLGKGGNVIKTRDDHDLILFDSNDKVLNAADCNWLSNDDDSAVNNNIFRSRIRTLANLTFSIRTFVSIVWVWNNKCN